jgi:type I restriction enzyme S subunit
MSKLPRGWAKSTLGEIGEYLNGRGFKKSEWRESGRPIIRIQNLTGTSSHFNHFAGQPEERYLARSGDILVSWAATLGIFVWNGPEAVVNQHIFKVRSRVDLRFHRYLLLSVLDDLRRQTHGSGMVHITKSRFENTSVLVPPLSEQERIVAAIEEQFSRLDVAEAALDQAQYRLKRLRLASLRTAIDNPAWPKKRLAEVVFTGSGGTPSRRRPEYFGGTIPWVKSGELRDGHISTCEETITELGLNNSSAKVFGRGTLLIALYGATVGKLGILDIDAATNQAVCAIVPYDVEMVPYLFFVLRSKRPELIAAGQGGAQPNISQTILNELTIPVPPLDEQLAIAAHIELTLSNVDALTHAVEVAFSDGRALRRAILKRAFSGKLVPQDTSDDPASALLERIVAERASSNDDSRTTSAHRQYRRKVTV